MGDRLKGVHLLPQQEYEDALAENKIDDDVIYVTPEDFSSLAREQVRRIDKNEADVAVNTNNINALNNELQMVKTSVSDASNEIISVKNTITEIILRDTNQDNRLTNIEETVTQLAPQVARALKTPMSAPSSTELVAVDTSNGQAMISIGEGLVIENDTLKATGGGGGGSTVVVDNLTSTSTTSALSANQGRLLSQQLSGVSSIADSNTEQIKFLQSDVAGKTNVTINNVHQDYINFSSDPQTQINSKANQSALDSTNSQVSTNTSNIISLNTTKANQSDLNSTNSRVNSLESTVTQLSPQVAKSLKTPISAPSSTELVAIDTSNGQAMISIGAGLVIENDTLKSTGGVQIVDNLTSTSISAALSANQGRILNSTISSVSSIADNNTEQIELLQSDMASKTNVTIANVHQDSINFTSNPQTQLDSKASQSALNSTNANVSANTSSISSLTTNKANKDLSNVTYPEPVANGVTQTGAGDRVVESKIFSDGQTWYRKWAGGWKECGSVFSAGSINGGGTNNYLKTTPIKFTRVLTALANTRIQASASGDGAVVSNIGEIVYAVNETTVKIYSRNTQSSGASGVYVEYYLCGY